MYIKHNRRVGPTARRRARTLGLPGAPESPVGDVPTAVGAWERVIDNDVRERSRGESRRTGGRVHDVLRLP